jgi:hypothetical protein
MVAAGLVAAASPTACAQIATLDKGHQILVDSGLQIWGLNTDSTYPFNDNSLTGAKMNAAVVNGMEMCNYNR